MQLEIVMYVFITVYVFHHCNGALLGSLAHDFKAHVAPAINVPQTI